MRAGLELGHAAAERASENAGAAWRYDAYNAIKEVAGAYVTFTMEDIRRMHPDLDRIKERRAWGGLVRRAVAAGLIEFHGYARAKSESVHGMRVTVWRSRVVGK